MSQPTPFNRGYNFTDYQAANPSAPLPGYRVDVELDGIAETLRETLGNLALIQRDDGKLADDSVTIDSISGPLFTAIVTAAGGGDYLAPNLTFTAHALAPGAAATVTKTGTYPDLTIDIGVPKGDAAAPGAATLSDGNYGDVTVSGTGSVLQVTHVNGVVPSFPGHTHVIADVTGLQAALDAKQAAGSYATSAQLAQKADAFTALNAFSTIDFAIDDGHNGQFIIFQGTGPHNVSFGSVTAGHACILANRGTASVNISCPGGYYKNGAAKATTNLVLTPNGKLTALHEGAGVWDFDGTGF